METDIRKNPALLKLDLYCKGIRIADDSFVEAHGGRKLLRTRAGLGSGLEVILPGGLWTNIPVLESFARQSPYRIREGTDGLAIEHDEIGPVTHVQLSPVRRGTTAPRVAVRR